MSDENEGIGLIGGLIALQRAQNEWWKNATREERSAAAVAQLRYIASVEPDSYGYLFDDEDA